MIQQSVRLRIRFGITPLDWGKDGKRFLACGLHESMVRLTEDLAWESVSLLDLYLTLNRWNKA
jgi:hypothetical protein